MFRLSRQQTQKMSGSLFNREEIERGLPSGSPMGALKAVRSTCASSSSSSELPGDVKSDASGGMDSSCSTFVERQNFGALRNQQTPSMALSLDSIDENSPGSSFSSDMQGMAGMRNLPMSRLHFDETFIPKGENMPTLFDDAKSAKMRLKASQLFEERMSLAAKAKSQQEKEIFSNIPMMDIIVNSICVFALVGGVYMLATTSFIPDSSMPGASEMATSL